MLDLSQSFAACYLFMRVAFLVLTADRRVIWRLRGFPYFFTFMPILNQMNTSRGGVIDEGALVEALQQGKIAGACLDVYENEPPVGSSLLKLQNVVLTPHIGASTVEAQRDAAVIIAQKIKEALV
jgi:hypothetical protein